MTEPLLRAVVCPEPIIKRTRNAAATVRAAEANGWEVATTYAIGWDLPKRRTKKDIEADERLADEDDEVDAFHPPEPVASILVRCWRENDDAGHVWDEQVSAAWIGLPSAKSLGFDGAWHRGASGHVRRLTYTELTHLIKGTEPKPTAKRLQALEEDAQTMLTAISGIRYGWPVKVLAAGPACQGKVRCGLLWLPCGNPAQDGVLCAGPCAGGVIADLSS